MKLISFLDHKLIAWTSSIHVPTSQSVICNSRTRSRTSYVHVPSSQLSYIVVGHDHDPVMSMCHPHNLLYIIAEHDHEPVMSMYHPHDFLYIISRHNHEPVLSTAVMC